MQPEERNALRSAVVLFREIGVAISEDLAKAVDPSLTPNSSVAILAALVRDGALRPQQLLAPSGLSSAGLSGALARLEAAGVVSRDPHGVDGDQRGVLVSLTPAGRRAVDRMVGVVDAASGSVAERVKTLLEVVAALPPVPVPVLAAGTQWQLEVLLSAARLGTAMGEALAFTSPDGREIHAVAVAALCLIDEAGMCRPGYLVERLGLTSGGITRVLDRLEGVGLVSRAYGVLEADRRGVFVSLTDAGAAAVTDAMDRFSGQAELVAATARLFGLLADRTA